MIRIRKEEAILLFFVWFFASWLMGKAWGFDIPAKDTDPFSPGNPYGQVEEQRLHSELDIMRAELDRRMLRIRELQDALRDAANELDAHGHPEAATLARSRILR
jgi:hypothetical protein